MRRRPLVRNALLLMGAAAVSRIIGTGYRILIVRMAGAEALGLFQMVMPVVRMASTVSTLRLPVALTRITADRLARGDVAGVHEARRQTALMIGTLSVLTAVALVLIAPFIAQQLLTDQRTQRLIWLVPLSVVPSALTGIFRGFAEGRQYIIGNALGQVMEQLVRVPVVVVLLSSWASRSVELAAAALVMGLGVAECVGLITVALLCGWHSLPRPSSRSLRQPTLATYVRNRRDVQGTGGMWRNLLAAWRASIRPLDTTKELLGLSLPLWVATMMNTTAQMINVSLIPRRLLVAGFSTRQATELYGQLTGMVMPLLYLPMIVVFPVSTVLTPAIADRIAAGRFREARRQLIQSFAGALAVAIVTSAAFTILPVQLPSILYGAPEIASQVQLLALAPPFVYTANIFTSVLQALGKTNWLLLSFVVTTVVRLVLVYVLTGDPQLGIDGALWAIIADYALTALINGWGAWHFLRLAADGSTRP